MDSQSKEAQGQGVKKLAKQHLTKKQGVEGGQALRRAQHLTNPSVDWVVSHLSGRSVSGKRARAQGACAAGACGARARGACGRVRARQQ